MIGTSYEMVYYLTLQGDVQRKLGMTLKQFNQLHRRVIRKEISESKMADFLTLCECVCIRPRSYAPAVFEKNGHRLDELSLLKLVYSNKKSFDAIKIRPMLNAEDLPEVDTAKRVAKERGWNLVLDRLDLPSVWSYEPHLTEWDAKHIGQVAKIFGYSL